MRVLFGFELRQACVECSHHDLFGGYSKALRLGSKPAVAVRREARYRFGAVNPEQGRSGCRDDGCECGYLVEQGNRFRSVNGEACYYVCRKSHARESEKAADDDSDGGTRPLPRKVHKVRACVGTRVSSRADQDAEEEKQQ